MDHRGIGFSKSSCQANSWFLVSCYVGMKVIPRSFETVKQNTESQKQKQNGQSTVVCGSCQCQVLLFCYLYTYARTIAPCLAIRVVSTLNEILLLRNLIVDE